MASLVCTLWAYRGFGGDLTHTAAALGIHRSTARYRLSCIRQNTPESPKRRPGALGSCGSVKILQPRTSLTDAFR
jgi:sugar diacid utilization regulator